LLGSRGPGEPQQNTLQDESKSDHDPSICPKKSANPMKNNDIRRPQASVTVPWYSFGTLVLFEAISLTYWLRLVCGWSL
jgi:hypothetical protein